MRSPFCTQRSWISSSERPFVSGTYRHTNTYVTTQKAEKTKNVVASPIASTIERKNCATRNAENQFTAVATAIARPRTRFG